MTASAAGAPDSAGSSPDRPCPICAKPAARDTFPFCSKRCADVDLHRWLAGAYTIPGADGENQPEQENEI